MLILVICDTSQFGIVPYPLDVPYTVHKPSTGDSARQLSMASMKVKSVNGVTARAKKNKKFALDIQQNTAKGKNRTISAQRERAESDGPA